MSTKDTKTSKSKNDVKIIGNRSGHRIELVIDNRVVVFLPGQAQKVPIDFPIPENIGLFVK